MAFYLRGEKVDHVDVLFNSEYSESDRRKALKYDGILFDAKVEMDQLRRLNKRTIKKDEV